MLARLLVVAAAMVSFQAVAADAVGSWTADLASAKQWLNAGKYDEAVLKLRAALESLDKDGGNESATLEVLVQLASAARLQSQFDVAEAALARALRLHAKLQSADSPTLRSELAAVQRAQGKAKEALGTLEAAIQARGGSNTPTEELAKDLTTAGILKMDLGDRPGAKDTLERALATWRIVIAPGSLQIIPALDALGVLFRDTASYEEAEPLFVEALRLRESAFGPTASELIGTIDSLAYVLFGQKKYAQAEPVYKRLLATWELNAGPEHPMIALTLDKMGEFYAAQQRYAEAEPLVQRALALRTRALMDSFNQTGRVELMQAKLDEARILYERAVRIGDDCGVPADVLDPLLRIESKILREMKRSDEANAIDRRVKAALIEKADREGRRPSPVRMK
jgi:tetratricopeptide (TPR) repeat protein